MILLNETYILELFGYFLLLVGGIVLLTFLGIGRLVFSTDKKTGGGKISRIIYLLVAGVLLLCIFF